METVSLLRLDQPAIYHIQVQGHIDHRWADWFPSMQISTDPDHPGLGTLNGVVADQAALLGMLNALYTLGLPILSVQVGQQRADVATSQQC